MTITEQIADPHPDVRLAGTVVTPEAMQPPGLPVPDDKAAVAMFTAHRLDETLYQLAHAAERMRAARAASGDLRAYHSARIYRHLQHALEAGHGLTANIRGHYPGEAAELEAVKDSVGLARSLTPQLKSATTAHLLETTLHEETHAVRHAEAMLHPDPADVWEFNADHAEKHLGGALEHAGKLAQHFRDNYPAESRWLAGLDETATAEDGDGKQHAQYAKGKTSLATISAQALEMAGTISAQVDLADVDVRPFQRVVQTPRGPRVEEVREHLEQRNGISQPKGEAAGEAGAAAGTSLPWDQDGDVMAYHGSLGVDRADMPQVSGTLADGRYAPSSEMMPKFLDRLQAKGVEVTRDRVPASSLRPTQTTGDARAVQDIADSLASGDLKDTKPVLVSSDNRVVDGHHQWAAHALGESQGARTGTEPGAPVIRANMPADQLMAEARQFAKDSGIQNRKTGVAANPKYAKPEARTISGQAQGVPPLTDAGYQAHADQLDKALHAAAENHLGTEYTQSPDGGVNWSPARAAIHQEILRDAMARYDNVPREGKALIAGGLGGAGKSYSLKKFYPGLKERFATVNPDDFKVELAKRGLVPELPGMPEATPLERSGLVHEESSYLAGQMAKKLMDRKTNIIHDITMSGQGSVQKRLNALRGAGYKHIHGMFVDIPVEGSVASARARHRQGLEAFRAGKGGDEAYNKTLGERFVPSGVIRQSALIDGSSNNRAVFNDLRDKGAFDSWDLLDRSSMKDAKLVGSGGKPFSYQGPAAVRKETAAGKETAAAAKAAADRALKNPDTPSITAGRPTGPRPA